MEADKSDDLHHRKEQRNTIGNLLSGEKVQMGYHDQPHRLKE